MRIALVTPIFPDPPDAPSRGAGIGAVTLVRALLRLRPDLDIHVVHYRAPATLPPASFETPAFTVHRLRASAWARGAPTPALVQAEVARVLRRLRPDVVHVRGTASLVDGAAWPAVLSIHGITEREVALSGIRGAPVRAALHRLREPAARARYRHIISIVGHVEQALEGQLRGRIHYVPNSVGEEFFAAAAGREDTEPLILQAGDLCPIKNALCTVEAAGILARQGLPFRLHLVGQPTFPDYAARVKARVRELGIADRVEIPGRLGREQMVQALARARVLALPSFIEVAPLAIAEASAVGVPAVVSPAGGNAEMVVDRYSGRLVSPRSPEGLAAALAPLLQDAALATAWGARARQIAERHRPAAVAAGTLEVYRCIREDRA